MYKCFPNGYHCPTSSHFAYNRILFPCSQFYYIFPHLSVSHGKMCLVVLRLMVMPWWLLPIAFIYLYAGLAGVLFGSNFEYKFSHARKHNVIYSFKYIWIVGMVFFFVLAWFLLSSKVIIFQWFILAEMISWLTEKSWLLVSTTIQSYCFWYFASARDIISANMNHCSFSICYSK